MSSTPELTPHDELSAMSPEALTFARHRWVTDAYEKLPALTREERDLARDRKLAYECSMWRVRFREAQKDLTHERFRADQAEARIEHLMQRIDYLIEAANAPSESAGVANSPGEK